MSVVILKTLIHLIGNGAEIHQDRRLENQDMILIAIFPMDLSQFRNDQIIQKTQIGTGQGILQDLGLVLTLHAVCHQNKEMSLKEALDLTFPVEFHQALVQTIVRYHLTLALGLTLAEVCPPQLGLKTAHLTTHGIGPVLLRSKRRQ